MKKLLIICACFTILVVGMAFRLLSSNQKNHDAVFSAHSIYSFTLTESDARIPCLKAEIEGIPFQARLDTGYEGVLSIPKSLLDQLTYKSYEGKVLFCGIKGKKYETSVFNIPSLYIGDLSLVNLPVEETNLEFERDTNLRTKEDLEPVDFKARIGWEAFLGSIFLIDLSKSLAFCCGSFEPLKERGYPLDQFVSTELFLEEKGLKFKADIGGRVIKCLLDTGCTLNLIHTPSVLESESVNPEYASLDFDHSLPTILSVEGRALGSCLFYKTQLPFGAEAVLGVDFLETQIVCIDFINRKLLLSPVPEENSLAPETAVPEVSAIL